MTKDRLLKICRIVLSVLLIAKVMYHVIPALIICFCEESANFPTLIKDILSGFIFSFLGVISIVVAKGAYEDGFNILKMSEGDLELTIEILLTFVVIIWAAISVLRKRIVMPIIAMVPLLFDLITMIMLFGNVSGRLFVLNVILLTINGLMVALLSIYCIDYFREKIKQRKLKKAMADQDVLEQQ